MSKHTPGPWKISRDSFHTHIMSFAIQGQTKTILQAQIISDSDARLISAAPDLLLAAKEAAVMLSEVAKIHNLKFNESSGFIRLMNAIKKAEG